MVAPYALCPEGLLDAPSQRNPIPETTQKETTLGNRRQKGRPALRPATTAARNACVSTTACELWSLRNSFHPSPCGGGRFTTRKRHPRIATGHFLQGAQGIFQMRPRYSECLPTPPRLTPAGASPGAALGTLTNPPSLSSQQPGGSPLLSPCSAGPGAHWDLTKSPTPQSGTLNHVAVRSQKKK